MVTFTGGRGRRENHSTPGLWEDLIRYNKSVGTVMDHVSISTVTYKRDTARWQILAADSSHNDANTLSKRICVENVITADRKHL